MYERDPELRRAAIRLHGTRCLACGFDFEEAYGERGRGYIEVHHLKPVSALGGPAAVDPRADLTVLCANCHRMVHRRRDRVLGLEELREIVRAARGVKSERKGETGGDATTRNPAAGA
ncbi:HNH endonuclease [Thermanaeromonas sp. C210]|uniref:HNH endonuclease n=1 Tax=Thermanaeromonas sp. C210 TaxID=2731925 RepID=UPI00155D52CD|nr:HNH endonuclease [Thermanaeromonas sp. C210]GFN21937.1 hypothetical protein TAMC210_02530 [Thermanaeromonas sp. C210]